MTEAEPRVPYANRPDSVTKHLDDLERFFGPDENGEPTEWGWGNGTFFHALRAVRSIRRYIDKIENEADGSA